MRFILIATIIFSLCSCKKRADESAPKTATSTQTNKMTATVNGNPFSVTIFYTNKSSYNTFISGTSSALPPYNSIVLNLYLDQYAKTGTYLIGDYFNLNPGECSATCTDIALSSFAFYSRTGTITVTKADTNSFGFVNFEATFSFNTDTVSGNHISVTNGKVSYRQ